MTFCKRLSKNKGSHAFFVRAIATRRPSTCCAPAPSRWASKSWSATSALTDVTKFFGACCNTRRPTVMCSTTAPDEQASTRPTRLVAVAADLLALTLLTAPGEFGADVASAARSASACRWALAARTRLTSPAKDAFKRDMPGRLMVGVSIDRRQAGAALAMQTREQHIRREKATSNICTAQVLLANIASMYAVYHGPKGLTQIANRIHAWPRSSPRAERSGRERRTRNFFDTLTLATGADRCAA
jgi:glycine dehydrogenase